MLEERNRTKILIVEDDQFLSNIYVTIFAKENFQVLTAGTGEEGWILAEKESPDIVLLDILLPGSINGLEVLKKMRENEITMNIPVIILSNCDDDGTISEGLKLGANGYFIKTQANPDDVLRNVKTFLR
jgi:DNA-binding response OmpR family regulator